MHVEPLRNAAGNIVGTIGVALDVSSLYAQIRAAHQVQMSLLPRHSPTIKGFEIHGTCRSAKEVGGDFYDYVWLAEFANLAIVLADVVGKGMKSAMYAAVVYGVLHAEAKLGVLPSQMLWLLNDDLRRRFQGQIHCAMGIATIDIENKVLRYANAGMPYPIIRRGDEVLELESDGLPLGSLNNIEYAERRFPLQREDVLFFLSDGIMEAPLSMNPEHFYMQTRRLETLIKSFDSSMKAETMIDAILADVQDFSGDANQSDDMTVVVIKVN